MDAGCLCDKAAVLLDTTKTHPVECRYTTVNGLSVIARYMWEDITDMDLMQIGCEGLDCIIPAEIRAKCRAFVNRVMNILGP
jgi:hypothetical protein